LFANCRDDMHAMGTLAPLIAGYFGWVLTWAAADSDD
jgi:hypothetical protein